jgi:periplasmic protein TonB
MESKKTNRANLENKRGIFLRIGFIIALAVCLLAFEWHTSEKKVVINYGSHGEYINEILPINTVQNRPVPPPPAQRAIYTINIVDGPDEIDNDCPRLDAGAESNPINPSSLLLPDEPTDPKEDSIFRVVQNAPEFPGGLTAMYAYIRNNIVYPKMAREVNIQGTVFLSFVVEKDGSLSDIQIIRSPDQLLSDEAARVVASMPYWMPGKQRGRPVRVSFSLPIKFTLQ